MNPRNVLVICLAIACSPSALADDSEKLDAILKELRELKQRVGRLETKLEQMSSTKPTQPVNSVKVIPLPTFREPLRFRPLPSQDVEKVIRLQTESPGTLLKGIHERERKLRNRIFLPDSVPQPYRRPW